MLEYLGEMASLVFAFIAFIVFMLVSYILFNGPELMSGMLR